MDWRLIISGREDPSFNMAVDYALWTSVKNKIFPPVLRFYQWDPPSVSLGYNQKPASIINTEFCRINNIPVVQRPTGGSAIFHDLELTYSFCGNTGHFPEFASPFSSYIAICRALIAGLEKTGVKLEIRGYSEGKEPSLTNTACFALSSRHDITADGRKVIGSAQKRDSSSFLQHGSILMDIRRSLWTGIFNEKVDFTKVACLKEFSSEISEEKLVRVLVPGFEEIFQVKFSRDHLSKTEKEYTQSLIRTQFQRIV